VTVLAIPGALGSLLANNGDAIVVSAASGSITLRNLVITDLAASQHGVHYVSGDSVTIEECEIHGLAGDGVRATAAAGSLTIKNSTIRSLGGTGVTVVGSGATLDRVNILRAANGVSVSGNGRVSIGNSTLNNFSQAGVRASGAGGAFARVQIVEFSDFQCPFCSRAASAVHQLKQKYEKDVRFVFRQFPLQMHPDARPAAIASLEAEAQGKFWAFHDKLFENQSQLDRASLEKHAQAVGLDMAKFKKALDESTHGAAVDRDLKLGEEVKVNGTPTIFLNGKRVQNATDFAAMSAEIDAELQKAATPG
jgi:protein-disulfide isomerase